MKKCSVVPFSWLRIILERCTRIWNLIENKLFSANRRNCLMSELNWKRVKKQSWIGLLMWVYHKDPKCQSWMFWSDCHSGQNIVDIEICQMSSQWKNFHFLLWRTNNADELGNLSLKVGKKDEFFMSGRVMHCFSRLKMKDKNTIRARRLSFDIPPKIDFYQLKKIPELFVNSMEMIFLM